MRITESVVHAADPLRTFEMLCDRGYQELRCDRAGATEREVVVELERETGVVLVVTRRRMPTADLPDPVHPFVGDGLDIVETVRWGPADEEGEREGALEIDVPGTPVQLMGGIHLRAEGTADAVATSQTVDGDLRAHLPLVGGRVEEALAPMIRETILLEQQVGREWLAQH